MKTPIVGLTCYREEAQWGSWQRPAVLLPTAYIEMVASAGGRPVVLPPFETGPSGTDGGATETIAGLDALVLTGGEDVGQNRLRDRNERALLGAALDKSMPVLAICRGHQLLNIHLGGTLVEDLPSTGVQGHRPAPGEFSPVEVEADPGSVVAKAMGEKFTVSCSHHQAVAKLGRGLNVTAQSADGVIEAMELGTAAFVVGVQWHPEEDGDPRLFEAMIGSIGIAPVVKSAPKPQVVNKAMTELFRQRDQRRS